MRSKIEMINCDCMEYMRNIPDNYFDLAIVDPPYGIFGAFKAGSMFKERPFAKNIKGKDWDVKPTQKYFKELFRICKNQVICGGNYFSLPPTRGIIAWIKPDKCKGNHPFFSHFEYIWTSLKKPAKVFERVTVEARDKRIHPAQKPVALYKWLLQNYAKEGDKIFDSHGGSGSICIACWDLKFNLVWIEKDLDYYNAAVKRFNDYKSQLQLF